MKERKIVAAALAAALVFATATPSMAAPAPIPPAPVTHAGGAGVVWGIFGCTAGIIGTAMAKSARGYGELTPPEAWTCGILYWVNYNKPTRVAHKCIPNALPERNWC
jgi:hypothetical protein